MEWYHPSIFRSCLRITNKVGSIFLFFAPTSLHLFHHFGQFSLMIFLVFIHYLLGLHLKIVLHWFSSAGYRSEIFLTLAKLSPLIYVYTFIYLSFFKNFFLETRQIGLRQIIWKQAADGGRVLVKLQRSEQKMLFQRGWGGSLTPVLTEF